MTHLFEFNDRGGSHYFTVPRKEYNTGREDRWHDRCKLGNLKITRLRHKNTTKGANASRRAPLSAPGRRGASATRCEPGKNFLHLLRCAVMGKILSGKPLIT